MVFSVAVDTRWLFLSADLGGIKQEIVESLSHWRRYLQTSAAAQQHPALTASCIACGETESTPDS